MNNFIKSYKPNGQPKYYIDTPNKLIAHPECVGCKVRKEDNNACTHCVYADGI